MPRHCGRPGCERPATASLGFDARRSLAWISADQVDGATPMCAIHADRLQVPNGWWLDDRRSGGPPQLFRGPAPAGASARSAAGPVGESVSGEPEAGEPVAPNSTAAGSAAAGSAAAASAATPESPARWEPAYDPDDDLGGLLDATTPLLSRAFHGPRAVADQAGTGGAVVEGHPRADADRPTGTGA